MGGSSSKPPERHEMAGKTGVYANRDKGLTTVPERVWAIENLRTLDLSRKALGFVSAIFIGTLLRGNNYITELILHSNDLSANGATIIVKQLSTFLKTLDIANVVRLEDRAKGDKKNDSRKSQYKASTADIPPEQLETLWASTHLHRTAAAPIAPIVPAARGTPPTTPAPKAICDRSTTTTKSRRWRKGASA